MWVVCDIRCLLGCKVVKEISWTCWIYWTVAQCDQYCIIICLDDNIIMKRSPLIIDCVNVLWLYWSHWHTLVVFEDLYIIHKGEKTSIRTHPWRSTAPISAHARIIHLTFIGRGDSDNIMWKDLGASFSSAQAWALKDLECRYLIQVGPRQICRRRLNS